MPTSFHQSVIDEFRANEGKVGGPFAGGDLLLLTTTGARSGISRTVPLGYVRHEGALLVVGSNLGGPRHPGWYHNLLARPVVRVEVGTADFEALAVPAEGERREQLFAHAVRVAPGYGDYQARTSRLLPVVVLERAEPEAYFASPGAAAGAAPGLGLQIRQRCLAFCQALEFHHASEDGHLFPGIARHHPHLGGVFDRLAGEHRTVARIQGELAALLVRVTVTEPERFRQELAAMSTELNAHLDYEEEVLLPLLADVPWPPAAPRVT
ncbi:nitroreductase/quinone reductase family protein [Streptomyces ardesiacus]|uniref:nitroreductase/quinone reductase family protein n=1 Tax=Streptomyces TaxID=1883 RepID=UPI0006AF1A5E|nr:MULTISPECIES: nitroreductase/quinone reductase family protein [Streptomyces]KOX29505.1 cation-binding protein [Streptomyces sp. NRRL F-4707]